VRKRLIRSRGNKSPPASILFKIIHACTKAKGVTITARVEVQQPRA
jgi:hypothetical protein